MPPVNRFTREEMVRAAVELVRRHGAEALTARALANELGCSAKPIFGLFENMEEVRAAVLTEAKRHYEATLAADMAKGEFPPYKASGMAYVRFATEERELFRLLFMCDRSGQTISENREEIASILALLQNQLQIDEDTAYRLHLELWVFVHGLATMLATGYVPWNTEQVSQLLTDAYQALVCRIKQGGTSWTP